eukprot:SAG11_NODE_2685_length_3101_cov_1.843771_2_plen_41_part_00
MMADRKSKDERGVMRMASAEPSVQRMERFDQLCPLSLETL